MEDSVYKPPEEDFDTKLYVCMNLECPKEGEAVAKTRLPRVDLELDEVPLRDEPMRICDACGKEMALCEPGGSSAESS